MLICFKRELRRTDKPSVWLSHLTDMPFIPPVGMEVIEDNWSCTVPPYTSCNNYAYKNNIIFVFESPSHKMTEEDYKEELEESLESGWTLSKSILSP